MKKILLISCLFIATIGCKGQTYGNEWIDYSQQYYKMPIFKEGIYRIDSTTLAAYFNLSTVNPKNFQLFLKGKEQFLFIHGESDNQINTSDFIEFYASPRMGDVDSLIYHTINYNPNPYAPLFNDTLYAFITLNTSQNNKRFVLETDTTSSAYPSGDHFYSERLLNIVNNYNAVYEYSEDEGSDPRYTQAEGRGALFTGGSFISTFLNPLNVYTLSPFPVNVSLSCSGMSKNFASPNVDHELVFKYNDANNNTIQLFDTLFYGYAPIKKVFTLNSQSLTTGSNFTLSAPISTLLSTNSNLNMLHYLHVFYPQTLDLSNSSLYHLYIDNVSSSTKSFYSFSNFNYSGSNKALLFDLSNGKKIQTAIANTKVRAVIPNGSGRKFCVMVNEADTIMVKQLFKINGTGYFTNFKNAATNKPFVIIYHKKLLSSTTSYANYRASSAGGSYGVIQADIHELYEQFGYGVNKHPVATRNFLKFLYDSLSVKPQFVLLIGKGIKPVDLQAAYQDENLVPTMGVPCSDHLFTAVLSPNNVSSLVPEIPIGRLAAINNSDVMTYLSKVQQHESSAPDEWKKKVLHFIGSDEEALLNTLSYYMDAYKQIAEDTLFGAEVTTFKKNTTTPIQSDLGDSIIHTISRGASLMNFFGHGATQNLDLAIDDPTLFNNQGKYPFFIANSCFSGNIFIHNVNNSVSQKYVFANQKGSIGYIATSSYSYDNRLNAFTKSFYRAFCNSHYYQAIGNIIKDACLKNSTSFDSATRFIGLQEILHGDPSLRIGVGTQPDYSLKNKGVDFDLHTYSDSIGIRIKMTNLGSATQDSFVVNTYRYFPNGDTARYLKRIAAPYFKDSLSFFVALDFNRGIGLNKFTVKLDEFNEIAESLETNNSTTGTLDLIVAGNDLLPVYPFKYAIVPKTNTITLKASTSDPFAPNGTYIFQLDTCDKFQSPFQSTTLQSNGGVLEWNVNLPYKDSTVYFWRVSRDSTGPANGYLWKESSFQTIGTKRGWSQAHFNQFKNDGYQFVNYMRGLRKFQFLNSKYNIFCRDQLMNFTSFENINFFFNTIKMSTYSCAPNGWNFVIFDSISGQPQTVQHLAPAPSAGLYNNCVCDDARLYIHSFGASNGCGLVNWKTDMENFLNSISPNNYVLGFTVGFLGGNAQITTYPPSLLSAFKSVGANDMLNAPDTVACVLFGKKGMLQGQAHETIGTLKESLVTQTDSISTRWHSGYIASEKIGPSYHWGSLHWRVQSTDNSSGDTTQLKLIGIKANGSEDTLYTFNEDSSDVMNLSFYINALTHPYLKLVAFMKDIKHHTSPQIKRWQVIYDEAAECALNPLKGFKALNDSLMEGDEAKFVIPIENIGQRNFDDSLVITYWLEDANLNQIPLPQKLKAKPFKPGDVILDTVKINSYKITGDNALWIYTNPSNHPRYQNEQQQFNNIARFPFKVSTDITNPLMDVTFDGIRILNGDIVSAKPSIFISLKDENRFLALNDTSAFKIFIQKPDQSQPQRLYFNQSLQFTPASLPKNSCSIYYNPSFNQDGRYTLIAQATDRSNNQSGSTDFRIQFEVKTKATITNVLNYPNPFSTSTRFVFTLTGSEIPEVFTIQIMTISGKMVKEITRDELGMLHIGRNISEYAWDGKDMYGDKLANGVYLYRVITKLNGTTLEKNSSGADQYFVKDFGKMVLMR